MGNPALTKHITQCQVAGAQKNIKHQPERVVDLIKTSPDRLPVLAEDPDELAGVAIIIRPPFHDVANAVGTAISRVSGSVDIIQSTSNQTVTQALDHAFSLTIQRVIDAGARKETVSVVDMEAIRCSTWRTRSKRSSEP